MGRDMLGQDYILKQITASLIYPESNLGKKFWDKYTQKPNRSTAQHRCRLTHLIRYGSWRIGPKFMNITRQLLWLIVI